MTFTVYSRDGCPYCDKVQQVLQLAEIKHVIYKLNRDFTRNEFYDKFGTGSTFPRVIKDDTIIVSSLMTLGKVDPVPNLS